MTIKYTVFTVFQCLILLFSPYICTHTNTQLKYQDAVYLDFFPPLKMIRCSNAR